MILIAQDMSLTRQKAIDVYFKSLNFGNTFHHGESVEIDKLVRTFSQRGQRLLTLTTHDYRTWVQDGRLTSVDTWASTRRNTTSSSAPTKVKQEEPENEFSAAEQAELDDDPYANEAEEEIVYSGDGSSTEPIDLTSDD